MNSIFIGITSASGGSGLTSFCIALSRILSQLHSKHVLCLSLDNLSFKMSPVNSGIKESKRTLAEFFCKGFDPKRFMDECLAFDDFGVAYLSDNGFYNPLYLMNFDDLEKFFTFISESEVFDYVILDIPFRNATSLELCAFCEKVVLCLGYKTQQLANNKTLDEFLSKEFENLTNSPRKFAISFYTDEESFLNNEVDIHGQFGAEVRSFAEELLKS